MPEQSNLITSGELARLIPVVADTSKEGRAVSVLLATLMAVDNISRVLLSGVGQRLGARANIQCYTEVVLNECPDDVRLRPDGLIVVKTGKREWSALVEAKIGRSDVDERQLKDYLHMARLNGIDAVITISNQFAALPDHHPIQLTKSLKRGVDLFHWSWMHVLTQATLILSDEEFPSKDQRFILEEMVRYLKHDSVGVSGFDRMNSEWKDLVLRVQSGAPLNKSTPDVENSVAAWHQECRDLCLIMSRLLGRNVGMKLPAAHRKDPARRLRDDSERLAKDATLSCLMEVPDAAAPILITADLRRRVLSCSIRVDAPKDKKRSKSRINWILRQLASSSAEDLFITAIWPGRTNDTQSTLQEARENPEGLDYLSPQLAPAAFEVRLIKDLAGKFSGRKTFIENIEKLVPEFYDRVGQHIRAWVPPPPKPIEKKAQTEEQVPTAVERVSVPQSPQPQAAETARPSNETRQQPPPVTPFRPWYQL